MINNKLLARRTISPSYPESTSCLNYLPGLTGYNDDRFYNTSSSTESNVKNTSVNQTHELLLNNITTPEHSSSSLHEGGRTVIDDSEPPVLFDSILLRRDSFILSSLPPISEWKEGLKIFCESDEPPVVLVDMDNTLVNWESQFERLMARYHPQIPIVPPPQRTEFKIELNYEDEYRGPILHLTSLDEFWLSMDPVPGAIEALKEMVSMGVVVFIVTTPDAKHTSRSAFEKIVWIEKHLGSEWKYRSILTHDKTLVKGDVLIDDKPAASVGLLQPSWTHALFAQPYNIQRVNCPRLDTWNDWGPTLYRILIDRETQKRDMTSLDINIQKKLSTASNEVRHQHPRRGPDQNGSGSDAQESGVCSSSCQSINDNTISNTTTTNVVPSANTKLRTPDTCCAASRVRSPIRNSLNLSRLPYASSYPKSH